MERKQIITIAGRLGSGKSSTAKRVSDILGYQHFSTGDFARDIAKERGISLMDLNKDAESNEEIDKAIDDKSREIRNMDKVVMDSRLGFHFIPESFRVFLDIPIDISAKRVFEDRKTNPNRQNEDLNSFESIESTKDSLIKRQESETKRYKDLYKIENVSDPKNFDLILDTSKLNLEEVSQEVVRSYLDWINNK